MIPVGVLVSGRGSNLAALLAYSRRPDCPYRIACVISDQPSAPALDLARQTGVLAYCHEKTPQMKKREHEAALVERLRGHGVQVVALAGFMRILGETFLSEYGGRTLNIHPSLLPAFPGLHAQEQAWQAGVRYAGCTVHIVDAGMDTGPILDQACFRVEPGMDAQALALRILEHEHRLYPETLARFCRGEFRVEGRRVEEFLPQAHLRPVWQRFAASHYGAQEPRVPASVPCVAVSACLCGFPCRYDGRDKGDASWMERLRDREILAVCPEVLAGLGVPRPRIQYENETQDTISTQPVIKNENGDDITGKLQEAVERIAIWCRENNVEKAVLKESSPSCGVRRIPWRGGKIAHEALLAATLRKVGIPVVSSEPDV